MKVGHFRQKIKPLMMPIAIVAGIFFHKEIEAVAFLAPALIFAMLLITFCRIRLSEVRIDRMSWLLLAVQLPVSLAAYFAVRPFSEVAAQGFFICIFCPTATAAPVITPSFSVPPVTVTPIETVRAPVFESAVEQ